MPAPQRTDTALETSHDNRVEVNTISCSPASFIIGPDAPEPWMWLAPSASYVLIPPPPEPDRATCYAASLAADDLLEDLRSALIEGNDLAARLALHTVRALAEVVLAKLSLLQ